MSLSITTAFIEQYLSEVHEAYQQRGSLLRNTIRLKTGIVGKSATFQKVGKGVAGKKSRHGNVPLMNQTHTNVEAVLEDWYGADYVDKLDELKTNIDERMVVANGGAFALGRKIDSLLTTAADGTSNTVAEASAGLTLGKIYEALEKLNGFDVPDDGDRYGVVGPHQWNELLAIAEFSSADYTGEHVFMKRGGVRTWLGVNWIRHTGLPISGGTRKCFLYHKTALGLAEGQDLKAYIDWVPEKAAHLINHCISAGAVLIDAEGVVEIACDDDATIS